MISEIIPNLLLSQYTGISSFKTYWRNQRFKEKIETTTCSVHTNLSKRTNLVKRASRR
jgi:hypothetical protein